MRVVDYNTYCDKYEDTILDEIDLKLNELNLPKNVLTRLNDIIYDYTGEILEYHYEDYISTITDRAYDEFKDSKLRI